MQTQAQEEDSLGLVEQERDDSDPTLGRLNLEVDPWAWPDQDIDLLVLWPRSLFVGDSGPGTGSGHTSDPDHIVLVFWFEADLEDIGHSQYQRFASELEEHDD